MAKKDARPAAKEDGQKPARSSKAGASKKQPANSKPTPQDESFSASEFVQGTQEELSKVIWPTRQQLISESAAVILMVGLSATIIYLVDNLFGWASKQIF
ncbi:MAG: preprotein translocase subunit SecE [Phormidesmis sp.]